MYKTTAHSKYSLIAHLVFVTKYRYRWLSSNQISRKVKSLVKSVSESAGAEVVEIETDMDHIHILVSYHPNICISQLVHKLKQKIAYTLWKEDESYMRRFYFPPKRLTFSRGYFVCSIGAGASYETIKKYIINQ